MKLLRYGQPGKEKPGLLGSDNTIRDLSSEVDDIKGNVLSPEGLERLRQLDPLTLPVVEDTPRLGPPVAEIPKFIGVGLNYVDHAEETGMPIPDEPILFTKATSCICGPNDDVILPKGSEKGDWEVELAFFIGTTARNVSSTDALNYVAGYTICNDISERAWQLETTGQWLKGKSFDTFGPIGPWFVTKDEIPNPQVLDLYLDLNGERAQSGTTSKMIFTIAEIVSCISHYMTLVPGDLITTGTPPGVGMGRKPQCFLKIGDEMHLGVQGLGEQRQIVVAATV